MRRIAQLLGAAALGLGVALLALATLLVALAHGFQRERVRAYAESALANGLGVEVSLGGLEGRLLPGFALRDLRIGSAADPQLLAQRIEIRFAGLDLAQRLVVIQTLHAAGVRAHIGALAAAAPVAGTAAEGGREARWLVQHAELRDARVVLAWGDGCAGPCPLQLEGRASAAAVRWPMDPAAQRALRLELELGASGALPDPLGGGPRRYAGRFAARARGSALRVSSFELHLTDPALLVAGEARLRLERAGVEIQQLELLAGDTTASVQGHITPERFDNLQVHVAGVGAAEAGRLAGLEPKLGGRIDAALRLDGPMRRPGVRGDLAWRDAEIAHIRGAQIVGQLAAEPPQARLGLRAELNGREIGVAEVTLPYAALLRGDPAGLAEAQAVLRCEDLDLAMLAPLLPEPLRSLRGRVRADLTLRGGAPPGARGWIEIAEGSVALPRLGDALAPFRARAALAPSRHGVDFEELWLDAPLGRVEARGGVSADALRDVHIALRRLDTATLAARLGVTQPVSGALEAELEVTGPFAQLTGRGALHWNAPRIGEAHAEHLALDAALDAAQLRADARVEDAGRALLVAHASLPRPAQLDARALLGPDAALALTGEGFDLAALAPFLPRQLRDLRGRADLALLARGGAQAPSLRGELRIADAALSVPLFGRTYAPIDGSVRFDAQNLYPELRVGPPGASAVLTGSLQLEGFRPGASDLSLVLAHFALARSRLLHLDVTGALRLVGPASAPELLGALRLERARLRASDSQDPILREIRIAAQAGSDASMLERAPAPPGALERARVELDVILPSNSWVLGKSLELELEGRLRAAKSPLGPVRYAGTVSAVRGRYEFLGKRFEVKSGSATFEGSERLDPLVDVEAIHRVRDVRILARLTGHLSNPVLQLTSEPPYEESDVLALLLTGRRADELEERTGGFDAAATQLAAGVAANELVDLLREHTPIDSLEVRIGEGGVPEEVRVGKYVWQDLFVRYGRTLGSDPKDAVGVQLRINEQWSVESEMAADGSAGADLVWSIDF